MYKGNNDHNWGFELKKIYNIFTKPFRDKEKNNHSTTLNNFYKFCDFFLAYIYMEIFIF